MSIEATDLRPDGECMSCAEGFDIDALPHERCPVSKRACDHHCNCLWTHDTCHWCHAEPNGYGGVDIPFDRLPRCGSVHQPGNTHNLWVTPCKFHRNHIGRHSYEPEA